ncbi:putative short chain dehydrogenase/oxidoreductase [Aspergillus undulatus]|uniref:putative short chain dehydrogenase/oxidoreductase n=1 Tax=Aspergillus undulatus TaxID=1810928 RepID=UPI003CCE001B
MRNTITRSLPRTSALPNSRPNVSSSWTKIRSPASISSVRYASGPDSFRPANPHADTNHIQARRPDLNLRSSGNTQPHRFPEFDLHGRVYAITGGGRGLGLAMAEALLEAGAVVYCLDRLTVPHPDYELARENAEKNYGGSLHYHRIDVRNPVETNNIFSKIASDHGRLDGLIAAAGINYLEPALSHSLEKLHEVMDINYNGVFHSATAAARQMFNYQQKGSILLVASMSGYIANKGMTSPVYNSSKAAVVQLGRNLAMEWGRHGIRVNSLCPGHIVTPMVEEVFRKEPAAKGVWEAENMLGRLATPEEFRGAALFALSDASSFMTGSTLMIDGGHTAW